ncbi:unnamed protein product [Onchocerca flexuosa]|uniref:Uncharacterized protein n=1 Tax=Onchocerca flexuosa TaxID=387005 RepID=A0A183HNQ9_9BILA|nr:unnamed protein product [Onchocerca flexuosa]
MRSCCSRGLVSSVAERLSRKQKAAGSIPARGIAPSQQFCFEI